MKLLEIEVKLTDDSPVVYIDDDELAICLFKIYYDQSELQSPLLTFLGATDFFEYLQQVKQKKQRHPAIIFLDINMPGMDGFEVLESLRADPDFEKTPAVSMLTSSDYEKDKKLAKHLGADDYLVKPVDAREYLSLFAQLS